MLYFGRGLELRDDPLVHAATRRPIECLRLGTLDRNPARPRDCQRLFDALVGPSARPGCAARAPHAAPRVPG